MGFHSSALFQHHPPPGFQFLNTAGTVHAQVTQPTGRTLVLLCSRKYLQSLRQLMINGKKLLPQPCNGL